VTSPSTATISPDDRSAVLKASTSLTSAAKSTDGSPQIFSFPYTSTKYFTATLLLVLGSS